LRAKQAPLPQPKVSYRSGEVAIKLKIRVFAAVDNISCISFIPKLSGKRILPPTIRMSILIPSITTYHNNQTTSFDIINVVLDVGAANTFMIVLCSYSCCIKNVNTKPLAIDRNNALNILEKCTHLLKSVVGLLDIISLKISQILLPLSGFLLH
jgi:hypothetical protein